MKDTLFHSDEVADIYKTSMGLITVWKKDGKSKDGVSGKEGTSRMVYDDPQPIQMTLKRKYKGA